MPFHRLMLATTLALALAGCQQDDDHARAAAPSAPGGGDGDPVATTVDITVVPSLGKVSQGNVTLRTLSGDWQATVGTGTGGTATFTVPLSLGPLIAIVCGGDGATYFDEGLSALSALGAGDCLRATLPDLSRQQVGVTALTEAAVRRLEAQGALEEASPAAIEAAHDFVRANALPEVADLLQAPAMVGSDADLEALPDDDAGRYALKLAALAGAAKALADTRTASDTPALDVVAPLADDLADGAFDGRAGDSYIVSPVYDAHALDRLLRTQLGLLGGRSTALSSLLAGLGALGPVPGLSPATGTDSVLGWQGKYGGAWSGVFRFPGNVSGLGVLASFESQLVDGNACTFTLENGTLDFAGLPFSFDLTASVMASGTGVRRFTFSRTDNAHYSAMGMMLPIVITTRATLVTSGDTVQRMEIVGEGSIMGITLQGAAGSCTPAAGG